MEQPGVHVLPVLLGQAHRLGVALADRCQRPRLRTLPARRIRTPVILPTRPGFDIAVGNWLVHGKPFVTGQLPTPDDPLYVSIDTEIRELTSPWRGGYPGDHWQSRVSTTLLYLEQEGDLPFTNTARQLPAKPGEWFEPKDLIP